MDTNLKKAQSNGYMLKKAFKNKSTDMFERQMLNALKKADFKSEVLQVLLPVYSHVSWQVPKEFGYLSGNDFKEFVHAFLIGFIGKKE